MQVLQAFEMEEAKITAKESKPIAICKDALVGIETSTSEVVCMKKHYRAHEMVL